MEKAQRAAGDREVVGVEIGELWLVVGWRGWRRMGRGTVYVQGVTQMAAEDGTKERRRRGESVR